MRNLIISLMFFAINAQADESPWPKSNKEIKKLVQNLGSDYYAVREKAQNKLIKIGFPAIGEVHANIGHKDLEISRRCQQIMSKYVDKIDTKGSLIFQFDGVNIMFLELQGKIKATTIATYNPKVTINVATKEERDLRIKFYKEALNENKHNYMPYADGGYAYNHKISKIAMRKYVRYLLLKGAKNNELSKLLETLSPMPEGVPEELIHPSTVFEPIQIPRGIIKNRIGKPFRMPK